MTKVYGCDVTIIRHPCSSFLFLAETTLSHITFCNCLQVSLRTPKAQNSQKRKEASWSAHKKRTGPQQRKTAELQFSHLPLDSLPRTPTLVEFPSDSHRHPTTPTTGPGPGPRPVCSTRHKHPRTTSNGSARAQNDHFLIQQQKRSPIVSTDTHAHAHARAHERASTRSHAHVKDGGCGGCSDNLRWGHMAARARSARAERDTRRPAVERSPFRHPPWVTRSVSRKSHPFAPCQRQPRFGALEGRCVACGAQE